ncbi:hypothetical protein GCM10018966_079460 [Streptomyces yanii]
MRRRTARVPIPSSTARLEQGRAPNPSAQVVEALARTLRLSGSERTHLFRLAGLTPPGPAGPLTLDCDVLTALVAPTRGASCGRLAG